jgi:hypothetical protein
VRFKAINYDVVLYIIKRAIFDAVKIPAVDLPEVDFWLIQCSLFLEHIVHEPDL